jgi:RimK family alpha-L-glutamate ligase
MKVAILTPKPLDIEVQTLIGEFEKKGFKVKTIIPSQINVSIGLNQINRQQSINFLKNLFEDVEPRGALVRGFGADDTQKIFFRLDVLTILEKLGIKLINSRESLEIATDKLLTSYYFEMENIPTLKTIICENPEDALEAFELLGGDVVLKPLFGSKGIGIIRLNDRGFAENVIYKLCQLNEVIYLQEFVSHKNRDIRILVLGDKAIAGMYRVSKSWKTNIHAGGVPKPLDLSEELKELAIKAAKATKTEIAGVDILETERGLKIIEVNSIPGFTALQKITQTNLAEKIVGYYINQLKNNKK